MGWAIEEYETETRLVMPSEPGPRRGAQVLLGKPDEATDDPQEQSFELEYQLRDFLAQNPTILIDGHRLKLYVDPTGRDGVEYSTAIGPIDVLATDHAGDFVVFELNRARGPDRAVGQLARYMGWVKQTIGRAKSVRGVIVAKSIDERLRYAGSVIPGVTLLEYSVEFRVRDASELSNKPVV